MMPPTAQGVVMIWAAAVLGFLLAFPAGARTLYQWVQLGPDGASARAITDDATCPTVTVDGADLPMAVRSDPSQPFKGATAELPKATFPVRACQATIPPTAIAATLDGVPLPLPKPNPS